MYSAYDNYYTIWNEDGIWGIYSDLDVAKKAVENHQADNGYYVRWSVVDNANIAKRYDGTFIFRIVPYKRDTWECPIKIAERVE